MDQSERAANPGSTCIQTSESILPTPHGSFRCLAFQDSRGSAHFALVLGEVRGARAVLARVHSECLTGDVFSSLRCDCGAQLTLAMERISNEGRGVLVYLRGHEGRGIGLFNKLRAYRLQDCGLDTVDANLALGLPADAREYSAARAILDHLGVHSLRLLTNNPDKVSALSGLGVEIAKIEGLMTPPHAANSAYLATKRLRMSHSLEGANA
jgi:3,4-dihydroxy 2-butanone 4-phosphate synthase / GTP cyclohydrolase II